MRAGLLLTKKSITHPNGCAMQTKTATTSAPTPAPTTAPTPAPTPAPTLNYYIAGNFECSRY